MLTLASRWLRSMRHHPFREVLRAPACRRYFAGQSLSLVGNWMQVTTVSWLTWELSHSALALGTNGALNALPALLLAPWSGAFADRLDRRRYLMGLQLAQFAAVAIFGGLVWAGHLTLWHCQLFMVSLGIFSTLEQPAQRAYLGDVVGVSAARGMLALNTALNHTAKIVGAVVAGTLLSLGGALPVVGANLASFAAAWWGIQGTRSTQVRSTSRAHPVTDLVTTARAVWAQPVLRSLLLLSVAYTLAYHSLSTLYPALAAQVLHGDAATLGRLLSATGVGALVGVIAGSPIVMRVRNVQRFAIGTLAWCGGWTVVVSLSRSVPLTMAALAAGAAVVPLFNLMILSTFHEGMPPYMKARVGAFWLMTTIGVMPVATMALGAASARWGVPAAFGASGAILGVVAAWAQRAQATHPSTRAVPVVPAIES